MHSTPPTILLKLDDVTRDGAVGGGPVSNAWQRCVDALRTLGVPAALGVIGQSLKDDAPAYFDWIRSLHTDGDIEFWNHGYFCRRISDASGEFEGPLAPQIAALQRTQQLGLAKLGITFRVFGPHWSATNAATAQAMAAVPEVRAVFAQPDAPAGGQFVFRRQIELERPTFVPVADALLRDVDALTAGPDYFTLQGHPQAWDAAALRQFTQALRGLLDRGWRFDTPSKYLAARATVLALPYDLDSAWHGPLQRACDRARPQPQAR